MTRIKLDDTTFQSLSKMGDGNPGALSVLSAILEGGAKIDPDSLSPMMTILRMDTLGIYGARLWLLHKDVCGEDLVATIGLIRANQLGMLGPDSLNHAIDNRGNGVDVPIILENVRERLPAFGQVDPPSEE